MTSGTGTEITVNSKTSTTLGSNVNAGWVYSSSAAVGLLDVLAGSGHAGPAHTIVGSQNGSGNYSNANGSLTSGPHNPFLLETATFRITDASITISTSVSATTFQFGTTDGSNQFAGTLAVPEPSSIIVSSIALGVACVIGVYRSRRRGVVLAA